jgi:hypothetical protein
VTQPRDLGHVQADEVRVKTQCGIVWTAMALMVSTRLWLGGGVSTRRDHRLLTCLTALIAASAVSAPILLAGDGFASYVDAFRLAFRTRCQRANVVHHARCHGRLPASRKWSSTRGTVVWSRYRGDWFKGHGRQRSNYWHRHQDVRD